MVEARDPDMADEGWGDEDGQEGEEDWGEWDEAEGQEYYEQPELQRQGSSVENGC